MERLDKVLVNDDLFQTRNKAQNEIKKGLVYVNNKCITKASFLVCKEDKIEIKGEVLKYVGKGGLKLEKALKYFEINLIDKIMIDIGSSTGGFCDCALQNGIKKIYAVDVGSDQFNEKLKLNKKIQLYENTDFRNIDTNIIQDANIVTIDVSFISITKLINKLNELKNINEIICLIKPQFECGKELSNKYKGIPLNKEIHFKVIKKVIKEFTKINYYLNNITYSPIKGGSGNIEYLAYFTNVNNINKIDIYSMIEESFKKL